MAPQRVGAAAGRILEVAAPPGDGWPDAGAAPLVVALVEGEADGLALARLRLPGVLIRAAGGTAGMIGGAALVRDLPAATAACLVSDGDPPGRAAVTKPCTRPCRTLAAPVTRRCCWAATWTKCYAAPTTPTCATDTPSAPPSWNLTAACHGPPQRPAPWRA